MKYAYQVIDLKRKTPVTQIIVRWIAIFLLATFISWIVGDVVFLSGITTAVRRPDNEAELYAGKYKIWDVTWTLEHRSDRHPSIPYGFEDLTEEMLLQAIKPDCDWIDARYDTMDFKATRVYRFLEASDDVLDVISPSGKVRKRIDDTFLNMKFWITEDGEDSVCYYSENHQITYFILAYLIGRRYPDSRFTNDGRTGIEKEKEARSRIITWLDLRGKYGFSEFYSHNYLPVDFGELSLLLLFGDRTDEELMTKTAAVLDILCLDYALAYSCGTIIGPQGRAYARNNMNTAVDDNGSDLVIDAIWNDFATYGGTNYRGGNQAGTFIKLLCTKDENGDPIYTVPEVIKKLGENDETQIVKTSFGLNLSSYKKEKLIGQSDKQIMFQLGSGALTNPEIINNTFSFVSKYELWGNDFVSAFKYCNITLLRLWDVLPAWSDALNIYPNGMALERANVYMYKTKDYKLASLANYKHGNAGAQQTTMALVLPGGVTIYTNHPYTEERGYDAAAGYFAGFGISPQSAQYENVCMLIHKIPRSVALSPYPMIPYTHTYLPEQLLDEVKVEGRYAFARKGNVLIAIIGSSNFEYWGFDPEKAAVTAGTLTDRTKRFELVQHGRYQATCYEVSTVEEEGDLASFMRRIKGNTFTLTKKRLTYTSNGKNYSMRYSGDFYVDSVRQATAFQRYDSEYVKANYLSENIEIDYKGQTYFINVKDAYRGEDRPE